MNPEDLYLWPGVTEAEAGQKLRQEGYNELPSQKKQSPLSIFLRVISEPMLMLLIGSGLIYVFIGEIKDALMLLSFVFVVVGITFYQERKTERTLEALKNLSSPRALVIRDGQRKRISGREVVRGDIILLGEGDRVPADSVVLSCANLLVDESLLTGESLSVRKTMWNGTMKSKRPGGDDLPFVYSGSLVVAGHGIAQVTATGINSEIGKIGKSIQTIKQEDTLLHKETARIVRYFSIGGIILCLLVVILYILTKGNILAGLLSGLTLSMAMLPEEFPVVLLIFLTLGAWRISKRQVLTRRPAAIETLGAVTVLCVDKTGTLTLNRMKLVNLVTNQSAYEIKQSSIKNLPETFHELVEYGFLASQRDPFDPIEKEIKFVSTAYLKDTEHIHEQWHLVREYPLSKELMSLSHVWESPDKKNFVIASKGAPETIADLCHLGKKEKEKILTNVCKMADNGSRVLGVAKALFEKRNLPKDQHDFAFEFVGLLGFTDPVRATVPDALIQAYQAGIRVIMITGDYPGTAVYIAKQIGLANPEEYITGTQLESLDHLQLRERIKTVNIFARVVPEQKLAIVNALKTNGEVVAMTGDGVNDAPALKSAHIGIAMGDRGTDVAREAAALVLLNDDFSSIVAAVRLGRRIFDNLKKAMSFIFSVHIPIAGMSLLPIVFNLPIVLLPAHIAFLELIIDPACSTVFESEPEDKDIMKLPPRNLHQPLFDKKTIGVSLVQGLSVLTVVFGFFVYTLSLGRGELEARSAAFTVMVFADLMLIVTSLSWSKSLVQILRTENKALWTVLLGTIIALLLVLYVPFLRALFHFAQLHISDVLLLLAAGFISLVWFEVIKAFNVWIKRIKANRHNI